MSQRVEIFFDGQLGGIEAVVMPRNAGKDPTPQQIAVAYRLLGRTAVMDPMLCENWDAVVVATPDYVKQNRATPAKARADGLALFFADPSAA